MAEAVPNHRVHASLTTNDEFFAVQWHLPAINAWTAWDTTFGDPSTVIAVIDSGVVATHPDLQGQFVDGFDFVSDAEQAGDGDGIDDDPTDEGQIFDPVTGEPSNDPGAGSFHGTHVTGIAGAVGNNSIGVVGVAWGARIMPLRALSDDSGSTFDVIQSIRYAAGLSNDSGRLPSRPADVINMSLGGGFSTAAEQNVISAAAERGVIIVAASGNDGNSSIDFPGGYNDVIAVGATDLQAQITDYSNQGSALDVVAPGGDSSADLNGDGYPDGILSTGIADGRPAFTFLDGTSMATPQVAAVIALMRSINPELDQQDIEALLAQGALTDDLGSPGRDNTYGYGLINAQKAVVAALNSVGTVIERPAELQASVSQLSFGATLGALEVILSNAGTEALSVTDASGDQSWLSATPTQTENNGLGVWTINVSRDGLQPGRYSGTLRFDSTGGPLGIDVFMRVNDGEQGDVGTVYVLIYDPEADASIAQFATTSASEYAFEFAAVEAGTYEIWAGTDNDNDFLICDEGEACGAFKTVDSPSTVELDQDLSDVVFSSDFLISLPVAGVSQSQSSRTPKLLAITRQ